jgi:hypothetical protein
MKMLSLYRMPDCHRRVWWIAPDMQLPAISAGHQGSRQAGGIDPARSGDLRFGCCMDRGGDECGPGAALMAGTRYVRPAGERCASRHGSVVFRYGHDPGGDGDIVRPSKSTCPGFLTSFRRHAGAAVSRQIFKDALVHGLHAGSHPCPARSWVPSRTDRSSTSSRVSLHHGHHAELIAQKHNLTRQEIDGWPCGAKQQRERATKEGDFRRRSSPSRSPRRRASRPSSSTRTSTSSPASPWRRSRPCRRPSCPRSAR